MGVEHISLFPLQCYSKMFKNKIKNYCSFGFNQIFSLSEFPHFHQLFSQKPFDIQANHTIGIAFTKFLPKYYNVLQTV